MARPTAAADAHGGAHCKFFCIFCKKHLLLPVTSLFSKWEDFNVTQVVLQGKTTRTKHKALADLQGGSDDVFLRKSRRAVWFRRERKGPRTVPTGLGEPRGKSDPSPCSLCGLTTRAVGRGPQQCPDLGQVAQVRVEAGPWGSEVTDQPLRGSLDIGV